jgi:hypothetical protein
LYLLDADRLNLTLAAREPAREADGQRVEAERAAQLRDQRLRAAAQLRPRDQPPPHLERAGWVLTGGLNLSVLDGWPAEAYDRLNGFAIGQGETHSDSDIHDRRDAGALCRVLQAEVVPLYYDRDPDGLPAKWVSRIKRAIRTLGWRFSAERMVVDYVNKAYIPAAGGTSTDLPTR